MAVIRTISLTDDLMAAMKQRVEDGTEKNINNLVNKAIRKYLKRESTMIVV